MLVIRFLNLCFTFAFLCMDVDGRASYFTHPVGAFARHVMLLL